MWWVCPIPGRAGLESGPPEEGQGAVRSHRLAVVVGPEEVLRFSVVLVQRLLDQTQAQGSFIEIPGPWRSSEIPVTWWIPVKRMAWEITVGPDPGGSVHECLPRSGLPGGRRPGRGGSTLAQLLQGFVDGIPGPVRGDLQDLSVGVLEIDAPEIPSVVGS